MILKPLTIALTAVSLLLGSALANAGQHDYNHKQGHAKHSAYHDKGRNNNRSHGNGHKNYNAYQPKVVHVNNGWHRGQYLPVAYQSSRYRVNDWRAYRLSAPPRGYEWRRIDNRFVQVSSNNYRIVTIW